ncbi:hypothetical protein SDC9_179523 [bioreactor metagenome]|uniref:Uncharacterized protein n=1 Tax=bioreactor metagenome TaxID=1076179 RepID=A0A645GZ49_9ZZZZ
MQHLGGGYAAIPHGCVNILGIGHIKALEQLRKIVVFRGFGKSIALPFEGFRQHFLAALDIFRPVGLFKPLPDLCFRLLGLNDFQPIPAGRSVG